MASQELLPLRRSDGPVMVQIRCVEAGKALGFELLKAEGLGGSEHLVDHPLTSAPEGRRGLLCFRAGNCPVVVGVKLLEKPIGSLLSLLPAHGLAAIRAILTHRRRGDDRCYDRECCTQIVHCQKVLPMRREAAVASVSWADWLLRRERQLYAALRSG
jgi:hypothetical protein